MNIDALYDLTKDVLKQIGEYDTAQVLLIVSTMVSVSNLEDLYEEHDGSTEEVYGFFGLKYTDLVRFRDTLISPDKNAATKLFLYSKVDLWNDSENTIKSHAAGNLLFQILVTYFYFKLKSIKIRMTSDSIMSAIEDEWANDYLPFKDEAEAWLKTLLVE